MSVLDSVCVCVRAYDKDRFVYVAINSDADDAHTHIQTFAHNAAYTVADDGSRTSRTRWFAAADAMLQLHAMRARGNTNTIDDEFGRKLCWERFLSLMIYNSLMPAAAAGCPVCLYYDARWERRSYDDRHRHGMMAEGQTIRL